MSKAIKISQDSTVTAAEIGDWTTIAPQIGAEYFDLIRLKDGADMFVDDTGLLTDRQVNLLASLIATESSGFPRLVVGDVLIAGNDGNGNTTDCPKWIAEFIGSLEPVTPEEIGCKMMRDLVRIYTTGFAL